MMDIIYNNSTIGGTTVYRNSNQATACRTKQWQRRAYQVSKTSYILGIQVWTKLFIQDIVVGEGTEHEALLWVSKGIKNG